jgi:hypothetical protein
VGEVPETPTPILVYNRIDANRRKTRLLLTSFAVALLPAVSSLAAFFIVPWMYWRYTSGMWLMLHGDHNPMAITILALPLGATLVAATFLISRYGSRVVLRGAHAQPVDPGQQRDLVQVVENLCIGAGLPLPRLFVSNRRRRTRSLRVATRTMRPLW